MIQQRLRTRGSDWPTCQGSTIMGGRPDAGGIRAASPNRCCSIYAHHPSAQQLVSIFQMLDRLEESDPQEVSY